MSPLARTIIKNTLTTAAVGVLLAIALPTLVVAVGAIFHAGLTTAAVTHTLGLMSPMWEGVFFGAFGGFAAAIAPVSDYLFGKPATRSSVTESEIEGRDVSYSTPKQQGLFPDFSDMQHITPKVPHTNQLDTSRALAGDGVTR